MGRDKVLGEEHREPEWQRDEVYSAGAVRLVYSAASDSGYGGYTVDVGIHIAQGQ